MYQYRIHRSTIAQFILPVCEAIYKVLAPEYMSVPKTRAEWMEKINGSYERWQFPNCYAGADGKHVGILCPEHSGSQYYNYKGFFSIVLLAFVDYDYKFLIAEVGCQGRISDGGVYRNSEFYKALQNQELNLPEPMPLPKSDDPFWDSADANDCVPMVFVADDAFPLTVNSMKPYGGKFLSDLQRIFDYRLSRLRRVTENAFGIWANRFRLFSNRANLSPEKTEIIVMASLALHNMLRTKSRESYTPAGFVDQENEGVVVGGSWRDTSAPNIVPLQPAPPSRKNASAEAVREKFCNYFNGPGQVPWQWNVLTR